MLSVCCNLLLTYGNCPSGYTGPGGLTLPLEQMHCTGGINKDLDISVMGYSHVYANPTAKIIYKTDSYDPEGLLGSLNSTFITYLGLIVGDYFVAEGDKIKRFFFLVIGSVTMIVIALAMSGFTMVDGFLPVNKNMWSLSYILLCAGLANGVMMIMFMFEKQGIWLGWPFRYMGLNAILIYCGHEILTGVFPFGWETSGRHFPAVFSSLMGVTIWCGIAYWCFTLDFFVKI